MFIWPINYFWLFKILRQIMQVPNLSHDVNSNILLNFSYVSKACWQLWHICFRPSVSEFAPEQIFMCSTTSSWFIKLVWQNGQGWSDILDKYHELLSLHLLSCFLLQGWLEPKKFKLCRSCCFQPKVDVDVLVEASTHSWASTSWGRPLSP